MAPETSAIVNQDLPLRALRASRALKPGEVGKRPAPVGPKTHGMIPPNDDQSQFARCYRSLVKTLL